MHFSRILGIISPVLALIGCLLPWAAASSVIGQSEAIRGSELGGWYPVAMLAPALVLSFVGALRKGYGKGIAPSVAILGLAATVFMIVKSWTIETTVFEALNPLNDIFDVNLGDLMDVKLQLGFFIETAGSALAIFAGLIGLRD